MKAPPRRGRAGRQKILVIEDDPVALADLQERLEANGYVVARAADAASAMTVVNRERPDLILLDLGLPGGDGHRAAPRETRGHGGAAGRHRHSAGAQGGVNLSHQRPTVPQKRPIPTSRGSRCCATDRDYYK